MDDLAKAMNGQGVVAILAGNQNAPNLQKRVQAVRDEAKKYPGITILNTFNHKETPQDAAADVEQAMQANPEITGWAMIGGWPLFTDNALKWPPGTVKASPWTPSPPSSPTSATATSRNSSPSNATNGATIRRPPRRQNPQQQNTRPALCRQRPLPVTKDNVDAFAKNWDKWLPNS